MAQYFRINRLEATVNSPTFYINKIHSIERTLKQIYYSVKRTIKVTILNIIPVAGGLFNAHPHTSSFSPS